ncbi:MAG TPA: GGDEF domain-containing protein, partial [Acidimicrobiales bacterium]
MPGGERGAEITPAGSAAVADAAQLLAEQAEILEGIARAAPLSQTLARAASSLERRVPGAAVTIGVLESDGVIRHPKRSPIPDAITEAFSATPATTDLGRLLRGAGRDGLVFDVATEPALAHLAGQLVAAGYVSTWVHQLRSPGDGRLLGVLAVLSPSGGAPAADVRSSCERIADLASIAIDRQAFEDRLRHQAQHDALTGLPNRQLLLSRVDALLATASGPDADAALLFVDLDQFKVINDSLGHAAGDDVL